MLVYTEGKNQDRNEYKSTGKVFFPVGNVTVLINEASASASEIIAGCIQDQDRGLIIGTPTYGKGLVQEQFTLPNKAAVRITVARYYLPSGRCIQKDYSKGKNEYQNEIYERAMQDYLAKKDTGNVIPKVEYYTSNKRVVYGNEGVEPDITVASDYLSNHAFETINYYNIIELFAANYYYLNKNEFKMYKNETQFEKEFQPSALITKKLVSFLGIHVKSFKNSLFEEIKAKVYATLKSEFAKLRFDNNAKYMVLSNDDEMVKKAVETLAK